MNNFMGDGMKNLRHGYTIMELIVCVTCMSLIILSSYTLYEKWYSKYMDQIGITSDIFMSDRAYGKISEMVLHSDSMTYVNSNRVDIDSDSIIIKEMSIRGNTYYDLCLNDSLLYRSSNSKVLSIENNTLKIEIIGEDIWYFKRIEKEI